MIGPKAMTAHLQIDIKLGQKDNQKSVPRLSQLRGHFVLLDYCRE